MIREHHRIINLLHEMQMHHLILKQRWNIMQKLFFFLKKTKHPTISTSDNANYNKLIIKHYIIYVMQNIVFSDISYFISE